MIMFAKKAKVGSDQVTVTITFGPEYLAGLYGLMPRLIKALPSIIDDVQALLVAFEEKCGPGLKDRATGKKVD